MVNVVDGEFLLSNPYNIISPDSSLSTEAKELFSHIDFMTGIGWRSYEYSSYC